MNKKAKPTPGTTPVKASVVKAKKSPHVPNQLLGYSLQTTRATARLLEAAAGTFVSVEVFDDVGTESANGAKTAEQTKLAGTKNPIADRSVDLWKTLSNWIAAVESGEIDPNLTHFELHISKKRTGAIAESFGAAADAAAATAALDSAKLALWGSPPTFGKRSKVAATLAPYVDHVLGSSHAARVIERFSISFGKGDAIADIYALLRSKIVSPEHVSTVANQMLGWTKATVDQLLEQGRPAVIAEDEFNRELVTFVKKIDRTTILFSFAPEPPAAAVEAELPARTYIRQLDLIHLDDDEKIRAANDFLRAALDRSIWAEKLLINKSSFDEFSKQLERTWAAKRIAVSVQAAGRPHVDAGKLLYAECIQVKEQLETRPVPDHFTPGCFHALADDQRVGWHPLYKDELGKMLKAKA